MYSKFSSITFEIFVIAILGGYLAYNIVVFYQTLAWIQILPITVQSTLMYLFWTKSKFLPIGIKIWAFLFILGGGMGILASILKGTIELDSGHLWKAVRLIIGVILYIIASKEIEIIYPPNQTSQ